MKKLTGWDLSDLSRVNQPQGCAGPSCLPGAHPVRGTLREWSKLLVKQCDKSATDRVWAWSSQRLAGGDQAPGSWWADGLNQLCVLERRGGRGGYLREPIGISALKMSPFLPKAACWGASPPHASAARGQHWRKGQPPWQCSFPDPAAVPGGSPGFVGTEQKWVWHWDWKSSPLPCVPPCCPQTHSHLFPPF